MESSKSCQELASILKGEGSFKNGVCTVTMDRKNINVWILGIQVHSLGNKFVFEQVDGTVEPPPLNRERFEVGGFLLHRGRNLLSPQA